MSSCHDGGNGWHSQGWMWNYFPLIFMQENSFLPTYNRAALKQLFICYINMYEKNVYDKINPFLHFSLAGALKMDFKCQSECLYFYLNFLWHSFTREGGKIVFRTTYWLQLCCKIRPLSASASYSSIYILWIWVCKVLPGFLISFTFSGPCSR